MNKVLLSSKKMDWETPQKLFIVVYGYEIDDDA